MARLVKKEMFNPNLQLVSVIPFWTLSMICYIKSLVYNLLEFPLLLGGTYVGSKNRGAPNKYDMIELQIPTTDDDGKIIKQMHRITKMPTVVQRHQLPDNICKSIKR